MEEKLRTGNVTMQDWEEINARSLNYFVKRKRKGYIVKFQTLFVSLKHGKKQRYIIKLVQIARKWMEIICWNQFNWWRQTSFQRKRINGSNTEVIKVLFCSHATSPTHVNTPVSVPQWVSSTQWGGMWKIWNSLGYKIFPKNWVGWRIFPWFSLGWRKSFDNFLYDLEKLAVLYLMLSRGRH